MYDIFSQIRSNIDDRNSRRIPTKTLLSLNPSSQSCFDISNNNKNIGTCLRQIWFSKNDYEKTNIQGVSNIANLAGNWFEDWFIDELKETNLYYSSNFPATDPQRLVKGLVDVAIINPISKEIELGEVKTYSGDNYYNAVSILGNKNTKPKPKDKHLLQAFRYSLIFKEQIKINNLFYIDRSCGSWYKNKQFKIELNEIDNIIYPKISTIWNDTYYEYTDTRISDLGIYNSEETLLEYFSNNEVPPKDFLEEYDDETIEQKYLKKEIPEYKYNLYKKDPKNNVIGDPNCFYCPFSKGLCKLHE